MNIGSFHPIFVHFPIVLLTLAFLFDLAQYLIFDKKPSYYSHWLYIAGTAFIFPSIITGFAAAEINLGSIYLLLHKTMAFFILLLASIQVVIRVYLLRNTRLIPNKDVIFLSVIIFLLVSLTGDIGGVLSRGASPFFISSPIGEFDYNSADSSDVHSYTTTQLSSYLKKKIDVLDVIPIFKAHKCASCHSEYFKEDSPTEFSKKRPGFSTWLPRDDHNNLVDWPNSIFYKNVILLNRMPIDADKNSKGISWAERLILLQWLENHAPTELPKASSSTE
jgi:uncharacterized membrane protein